MKTPVQKELEKLLKKEQKYVTKESKQSMIQNIQQNIEQKIPSGLVEKLQMAFSKAFYLVFEKGSSIVEKTISEQEWKLEFEVQSFRIEKSPTKKSLKKLEQLSQKSKFKNMCLTTVEGVGLGVLGIGLPDIPLFLGMLMKGLYEISMSYGYDYKEEKERIFLLRVIAASLSQGEERKQANETVEQWLNEQNTEGNIQKEIERTASILANTMLVAKFVQGLPVVGVAGGMVNTVIYHQVMQYASMKYKKRYLQQKING